MKDAVAKRFRAVLDDNGWCQSGRILLGVSGGSDSTALLLLFAGAFSRERLVAAHLNHGTRETAGRDCEFVRGVCGRLGVTFVSAVRPVSELALKGESYEAAARRVRYDFYEKTRGEYGCEWVALGHTRTDLAESVLMNAARGCGLRGLAGIPPRRGAYIRPLLAFTREDLRAFLLRKGQTWVEDETNSQDFCLRNRVRNEVMPYLRAALNPAVAEHLAALAEDARDWRDAQEERCAKLLEDVRLTGRGWPAMDLRRLRRASGRDRVELLRRAGRLLGLCALPRDRTELLDRLIVSSGRWVFQWGSEVDLTAYGGALVWHPASEKRVRRLDLRAGERARWGGWAVSIGGKPSPGSRDVEVPADPSETLTLRAAADGEGRFNDCLPEIALGGEALALRSGNAWRILSNREGDHKVVRVVFTPLRGEWRRSEWN